MRLPILMATRPGNGRCTLAILVSGEGAPDGHFILDLKQEAVSAAALYGPPQPDWPNDATRIATVRRWTQPHPPMLFDAVRFRGKTWLLRELQPTEDRVKLSKYVDDPKALKALLTGMGRVTASMHLRDCAKQGAASVSALRRWAEISWTDVIESYAEDYAAKVREDFGAWQTRDKKADPTGQSHRAKSRQPVLWACAGYSATASPRVSSSSASGDPHSRWLSVAASPRCGMSLTQWAIPRCGLEGEKPPEPPTPTSL
jgi:Uncharacterized protein conserved in bacteria (DUF2252)